MSYNMSSPNMLSQADLLLHQIANRLAEDRAMLKEMDKTITRIEKKLDQLEAARDMHHQSEPEHQPRPERPYPWSQLPYGFGIPRVRTPPPRTPLEGDFSATSTPSKRKPASFQAYSDELRHSVSKLSLNSQSSMKPLFVRTPRNIVPLNPSDFPVLPSPSTQQGAAKAEPVKPLSISHPRSGSMPDIPGLISFPEAQRSPIHRKSSIKNTTRSSDLITRTASSTPSAPHFSRAFQWPRPVSCSPSRASAMPQPNAEVPEPQPSMDLSKEGDKKDEKDDKDDSDAALQ